MATESPLVVAGVDELLQSRMHGLDVIQLEEDLEEILPVEWTLLDQQPVEDVAGKVVVGGQREVGQISRGVAGTGEKQSVPVVHRYFGQRALRRAIEIRRAEQLAVQVIGPAMQRADDVLRMTAAFEQQALAMPARIGH